MQAKKELVGVLEISRTSRKRKKNEILLLLQEMKYLKLLKKRNKRIH
ncbi:hypothetical protein LR010_02810 [Candidatus Gracilibacteria bacterium]|nr:hypothetical protein [Candidatus Gracilibacteria bacterium]